MDVPKLAEMYDINYNVLYNRIYKLRWPLDKALTTPVGLHRRVIAVSEDDLPPIPQKATA